jgi:hypothetical protein
MFDCGITENNVKMFDYGITETQYGSIWLWYHWKTMW